MRFFLFFCFFFANVIAEPFQARDYSYLIGMEGLSKLALDVHFKLYQGYVKNANLLLQAMDELKKNGKENSPEWAEMRRRFGWEYDGVRLHELYFENLGGDGQINPDSNLAKKIVEQFGSIQSWKESFRAIGAMRGIGWAILYNDPQSGRLFNVWINEHDVGHLAGGVPLIVMDLFEHAYLLDYQTDKVAYMETFFKNLKWDVVNNRL